MTRTPFDEFSKQYLKTFLSSWGTLTRNQEVSGESTYIDIMFVPALPPKANAASLGNASLGLLGRFAATPCLLEPFRHPPTSEQVCSCLYKLLHVRADYQRQAKREDRTLTDTEQPRLWILSPSAPPRLLSGFNLTADPQQWGAGIYFWGPLERAAIVAINQLPVTPATLWVRLLGKGKTQEQAVTEVLALSKSSPLRANALKLLTLWKISIEIDADANEEERKFAMTLSQAYLEWEQKTEQRGIQKGVQQGIQKGVQQGIQQGAQQKQLDTVQTALKVRFGALDEQLSAIVQPFAQLPSEEYTRLLLQLQALSREELLAKFGHSG